MKTFFHEIEPYQIQAAGVALRVVPMTHGVYRVCENERKIADLYPEITAAGIHWNAFGQLPARLADEIGSQIYACEI